MRIRNPAGEPSSKDRKKNLEINLTKFQGYVILDYEQLRKKNYIGPKGCFRVARVEDTTLV